MTDPYAVSMKLAMWASATADAFGAWRRVTTLFTSSGNFNGTDPRAALWAPMPFYDNSSAMYHLFYVAYRCSPNNSSGW